MKLSFLIILSGLLLLSSCKNDDDANDCGCNSNSVATVDNLTGVLFHNVQNENSPDAHFVVVWTNQEMPGWQTSYYVCHDALVNGLGEIPETGKPVSFSGDTKELCQDPISIPEHFHYQIELTQINTI